MKTIAAIAVLAVLAIAGYIIFVGGHHAASKVQGAYTTVQDMNDEQDAILKGAK